MHSGELSARMARGISFWQPEQVEPHTELSFD